MLAQSVLEKKGSEGEKDAELIWRGGGDDGDDSAGYGDDYDDGADADDDDDAGNGAGAGDGEGEGDADHADDDDDCVQLHTQIMSQIVGTWVSTI